MKGFDVAAGLLEAAIVNGRSLPETLSEAGAAIGFDHFSVVHDDLTEVKAIAAVHTLAAAQAYQAEAWLSHDHRARALAETPPGTLYVDNRAAGGDLRDQPAIVRDFFVPQRMASCAAWRFPVAGETWILGLARGEDRGPIEDAEQAMLKRLMPLANRALIAAHTLRQARIDGLSALAGQLGLAVLVMDQAGRAIAVSAAAEMMLGDDLYLRDGRLFAARPDAQGQLEVIEALARQPTPAPGPHYVVIERLHGGWPILLRIMPLRGMEPDILPGGRLLVAIEDRRTPLTPSETELRLAYGLSDSEIRVATLLAAGLTPREIAAQRKVVIGTVRMQIREIYAKMGARRLSDLVAILARYSRIAS